MSAKIIDGKAFAAKLKENIAAEVAALKARTGKVPGLAVVLAGENPASRIYVRNKGIATREAGMASFEILLPADVAQASLLEKVKELNADARVHGILVQLPLPSHMDECAVIQSIAPEKDVDGFHAVNAGKLATGQEGFVPCTPLGCLMLIKDALGGDLSGKRAVVIGRSNIVGKPMAALLLKEHCTVTIAHSRTRDIAALARQADILVAAAGKPHMVGKEWVKRGACVIDVGINRIGEGGEIRLVGDVNFEEVQEVAGHITPVPGGVGPMTIACLLRNTLAAFTHQA